MHHDFYGQAVSPACDMVTVRGYGEQQTADTLVKALELYAVRNPDCPPLDTWAIELRPIG